MGAAKVRKKNGTYPTAEQIAAMEEQRRRDTKVWYPTFLSLMFRRTYVLSFVND